MMSLKGHTVSVNRYVRPSRVALIVNVKNPEEELAKVIEWCTFSVCGPHNSIFLAKSLKENLFKELLYLHDPDFVVWVGKEDRFARKIVEGLSSFSKSKCMAFDGKNLLGITLPMFMKQWKARFKATLSTTPPDHRLFLSSAAIMGILSEDHRQALSQWFDFEDVDYRKANDTRLMTRQPFTGMIRTNMEFLGRVNLYFQRCYATDEVERRFFETCIVVDKPDNLAAISLFWNLRAIYHTQPYIFFLPSHFLESKKAETEQFLWSIRGVARERFVRILSCSLSPRFIGDILERLFSDDVRCDEFSKDQYRVEKNENRVVLDLTTARPSDLFDYAHMYYGESDSTPVSFNEKGGYLPYPQPKLGACDPEAYHVVDFDIPFFKPIRSKTLKWYLGFGDAQRLSRAGVSVLLGGYASQIEDHLYLRLIDNAEGIGSSASDRGLLASASDKGKMATQFLNMMESIHETRFLTGSNVIAFLRRYDGPHSARKSKSHKIGDSSPLNYDDLSRSLMSQYADQLFVRSFVGWMLRRRLLTAGIVVRCGHCYNRQFVLIDQIRHQLRCPGCRSLLEIPLDDYRHLTLHYVLNTLLVSAIHQGFLAHLLAAYFLIMNNHGGRSYRNLTFFYPGVKVSKEGKSLGELDFVLMFDGEIITGECKLGGELTSDEVAKTITLSKRIGADVVTFCTTDKFSNRSIREISKVGRKKRITTAVIDGRYLADQSAERWMWKERAHRGERVPPDSKLFCDDVVRSLSKEE